MQNKVQTQWNLQNIYFTFFLAVVSRSALFLRGFLIWFNLKKMLLPSVNCQIIFKLITLLQWVLKPPN